MAGTIVVDFIHMGDGRRIGGVIDGLRRHMRRDRTQHRLGELSALGLLELTRRRVRPSLSELLCEPAAGDRRERRVGAVAAEVLRRAEAEGAASTAGTVTLTVAAEVAAVLEDDATRYLDRLRERTGKAVELELEPAASREAYDIGVG